VLLLAGVVALLHGVVVLVVLTGAFLALRRPWVLLLHAPVALAALVINLGGADCPVTDLERWLRGRAGQPGPDGGFLSHYVLSPLGADVAATATKVGVLTVVVGVNAVGYGLLARRALARRALARRAAQPV
jgi:hypothetical protein